MTFFEDHRPPLIIAHRGASRLAPENTPAAVRAAAACGADAWECDVRMTADGEVIVFHDPHLARTTDVARHARFAERSPWPTHAFTLAEIRQLSAGAWFEPPHPGNGCPAGIRPAGFENQKVMTLEEALFLTARQRMGINIEIKSLRGEPGDALIVRRVARTIRACGMTSRVLVSSFNLEYLWQLKRCEPAIPTAILTNGVVTDPLVLLRDLKAAALHPRANPRHLAQAARLKAQGVRIHPFVINEPSEMARWVQAGANGVFTDCPQRMTTAAGGRGHAEIDRHAAG